MVTVEQKLRSFEEEIIKKVEDEVERKLSSFREENNGLYERQKEAIDKECDRIIQEAKRNSQIERQHILSKAEMDKQAVILKKRKEILDRAFEDILVKAKKFTEKKEYEKFLLKSIDIGIAELGDKSIALYINDMDLKRLATKMDEHFEGYRMQGYKVSVKVTDEDIVGGCIVENESKTRRVDCTLISLLNENRSLIGKDIGSILQQGR